jgi:hypothetical protein
MDSMDHKSAKQKHILLEKLERNSEANILSINPKSAAIVSCGLVSVQMSAHSHLSWAWSSGRPIGG